MLVLENAINNYIEPKTQIYVHHTLFNYLTMKRSRR